MERRDRVGPVELVRDVPPGSVHDEDGVAIGGELAGQLVYERLHGGNARLRQHEGNARIPLWANSTKDPCSVVAHVPEAAWANTPFIPDPSCAADLPHAGFVLVPQFDGPTVRLLVGDLRQPARESFLKRSRAAGSALGWLGRVFW